MSPVSDPSAGTRERIISAAREEFAQFGIDGARVDRIARKAAVNKAMLYYHFHSKELLYEAVVKEFFLGVVERLRSHIEAFENLEQALAELAETHAQMVKQAPGIVPILLRELANPQSNLCEWIAGAIGGSGITSIAEQRLDEAVRSGRFRKIEIRQAMISFITMSLGYHLMAPLVDRVWNVTDREVFVRERKAAIVDLFLNGVKVKPI